MIGWLTFLFALLKPLFTVLGVGALLYVGALKLGPRLPAPLVDRLQERYLRKGMALGGSPQMLVQDSDGVLSLADATYDSENGGYWARIDGKRQFFSAEGDGGGPKWFYGSPVVLAYDGLGAASDLVSAEIGRQAKVKKQVASRRGLNPTKHLASAKKQLLGRNAGGDASDPEAVADGGHEGATWKAYLPKRAVVDLRDTLHNAPFHVRPEQFDRVEENARAGQSVGFDENLIRIGMLMTGFMLAVIAFYVFGGNGGGGGGGGVSLPMMLASGVVGL